MNENPLAKAVDQKKERSMYPELPHLVDLSSVEIVDQGDLGSSTACASSCLSLVSERRDPVSISDVFLYYDSRQLEPPRSGVRRLVELLYRNGHIQ